MILIINGSPRKNGNVAHMLKEMKLTAEEAGAEVKLINISELNVKPCIGCMKCRTAKECCLPADDSLNVMQLIKRADSMVIGAPCYWGNMPGQLKMLFDRMVYGLMGESESGMPQPLHKGKRAVIVTVCNTIFPFNIIFKQSRGTANALKEILKWSGFKVIKTVERGGMRKHPQLTASDLKRCKTAITKLLLH